MSIKINDLKKVVQCELTCYTRAILLSFALFLGLSGHTQNTGLYCLFDSISQNKSHYQAEGIIRKALFETQNHDGKESGHDTLKIIPVVVHVIHDGGNENISETQVQSQIQILNEDFGRIPGSNGYGNGVDTRVRFCLARKNPDGNCTNGIVRIKSSLTNHQSYQRALLKELSFWDNTRYLNIYIVRNINGNVGGYSSFPGGAAEEDGVVVRHNLFGNRGTATGKLGRTTTHELGHYFGLYHVFNNGCGTDTCTDGDFICDTPPASVPHYSCTITNSCSNDSPDLNDQIENYMDYTPDACKNMLTQGQKDRIQATLSNIRTTIWSQSNLISTGCDTNYIAPAKCVVHADFVTLNRDICEGNSVYFMDKSLNSPTNWQWYFEGGTPSMSNLQNPAISYDSIGTFSVKLIVNDTAGIDSVEFSNYIKVNLPGKGNLLSYGENFDSGVYPPASLVINNHDGGVTWELDSMASVSGKYSIKINNLINTNYGSSDELILPYLNFSSAAPNQIVRMTFKWAYAKSDPTFSDELLVLLSTDCGNSFNRVFYKTQNNLATGPTQTTPFVPDSTQWANAYIYLDNLRDETYVQLKIVNVTDGGNNLYIDDIYVGDGSDPINAVQKFNKDLSNVVLIPNPARNTSTLQYSILQKSYVSVSVYGVQGKKLKVLYQGMKAKGIYSLPVELKSLQSGMYYVVVRANSIAKTLKLIVYK